MIDEYITTLNAKKIPGAANASTSRDNKDSLSNRNAERQRSLYQKIYYILYLSSCSIDTLTYGEDSLCFAPVICWRLYESNKLKLYTRNVHAKCSEKKKHFF